MERWTVSRKWTVSRECVLSVVAMLTVVKLSAAETLMSIVSLEVAPYLQIRPSPGGRAEYYGYIPDLMEELLGRLGIGYKIYLAPDGKFGNIQPDGSWNGMVEQILQRRADIAAGPLYITYPRAQAVQFTDPFMNISATFLMNKHTRDPHLRTVEDLLSQSNIVFGTKEVGTIVRSFKTTNNTLYKHLWQEINNLAPYSFTADNNEGIERIRFNSGRYVFILPSDIANYIVEQEPCDLVTFKNILNVRHFGLALPKKSPLVTQLNRQLTILEETGVLHKLYNKWWIQNSKCREPSHLNYLTSSSTYNTLPSPIHMVAILMTLCRVNIL